MSEPGDITRLLQEADQGNAEAANQLFGLIEHELVNIAKGLKKSHFAGLAGASTMGLVDEAFVRIVGQNKTEWQPGDRRRFFAWIAKKVNDLLADAARKEKAKKRGGDYHRVGDAHELAAGERAAEELNLQIDLHSALAELEKFASAEAEVFRQRYFLDASFEEIADIMGVAINTVRNRYLRSRHWLQTRLKVYMP